VAYNLGDTMDRLLIIAIALGPALSFWPGTRGHRRVKHVFRVLYLLTAWLLEDKSPEPVQVEDTPGSGEWPSGGRVHIHADPKQTLAERCKLCLSLNAFW
jgi:hypothetical protein